MYYNNRKGDYIIAIIIVFNVFMATTMCHSCTLVKPVLLPLI